MVVIVDHKGDVIFDGDIIKSENSKTNTIKYYLYSESFLYLYDNQGEIHSESLNNIRIGPGITLINEETKKWTKIGPKEEVYNKIFDRKELR